MRPCRVRSGALTDLAAAFHPHLNSRCRGGLAGEKNVGLLGLFVPRLYVSLYIHVYKIRIRQPFDVRLPPAIARR